MSDKDKDITIFLKKTEKNIEDTHNLKKQLEQKTLETFNLLVDACFDLVASLTKIHWVQYTPYQPGTEFSIHQVYFESDDLTHNECTLLENLEKFLYANESFLYSKFGDDSKVVITRSGISLEAVEHRWNSSGHLVFIGITLEAVEHVWIHS